jgi:hypothetical protein
MQIKILRWPQVYKNILLQFDLLYSHLDEIYFIYFCVTLCIISDHEFLKKQKPFILHCYIPRWPKNGITQKINYASG